MASLVLACTVERPALDAGLADAGVAGADAAVSRQEPGADDPPAPDEPCIAASESSGSRPAAQDRLQLTAVSFRDLPGWADDRHDGAIPAFLASCEKLAALPGGAAIGVDGSSGRARDWRPACAAAAALPRGDAAAARAFFEAEFSAWAAAGSDGRTGKLTGYHVQALRGSRKRHGRYQVPIWSRPPDLVSVDLTAFLPDARGRRIWGRLDPKTGA
ncbi:MAG TPA: MltA domain-containing protein, partial [Kofleriaceae bacterium]|nr:MltA domain-containing protein [Kofleriaceae bacterium]